MVIVYDNYKTWRGTTRIVQVYTVNGTLLWGETIYYEYLWAVSWSPDDAVIDGIAWASPSTRTVFVTYGSSRVIVFYAGPHSSPTPVLPSSNSTSSTVGGVIFIPTGEKGNITGELFIVSSVMIVSLLSILTSYTMRRGLGEE